MGGKPCIRGALVSYGYDASYQLTNEQRSGANAFNMTYGYDALGNRLTKTDGASVTTYSYGPGNQLKLMTPPSGQPTTSTYL